MAEAGQPAPVADMAKAVQSPRELVVKGVKRIEAIILPWEDERRVAELYTHTFSRVMRRDFNLTSVKLFWFTRQRQQRATIQSLPRDLAGCSDSRGPEGPMIKRMGFLSVDTVSIGLTQPEAKVTLPKFKARR